jgi:hypothetical protein
VNDDSSEQADPQEGFRRIRDVFAEAAINCSFCGKDEAQVGRLVAGPRPLCICRACIESSSSLLLGRPATAGPLFQVAVKRSARCSFCNTKRRRVWKLLERAGRHLCSGCVEIANRIVADGGEGSVTAATAAELQQRNRQHWVWHLSGGDFILSVRWR